MNETPEYLKKLLKIIDNPIKKTNIGYTDWEELRKSYLPDKIKILLIANAAPKYRFFYSDDEKKYDGLFKAVAEAMNPELSHYYESNILNDEIRIKTKRKLLSEFKNRGGFLMDLLPKPSEIALSEGDLSYWQEEFKRKFDKNLLDENCKVVLCHTNSQKLWSFFRGLGYNAEKLPCPVQQNYRFSEKKGTFVRKLTKIFENEITHGQTTNENP